MYINDFRLFVRVREFIVSIENAMDRIDLCRRLYIPIERKKEMIFMEYKSNTKI